MEAGMQLDLVDGGDGVRLPFQPLEVLDPEVGDADRPRAALVADPLERLPGLDEAVLRRRRPVDQVEVEVLHAEPGEALFEGRQRRVEALLFVPELGRDEDILARIPEAAIAAPTPFSLR